MQPAELQALKDAHFNGEHTKNFMKNVWRYNCEMSFGTLVLEKVPNAFYLPSISILLRKRFIMACK
jgi:hypothetical protein